MSIAHLKAVSHSYKSADALNNISLEIPQGKMVVLIGPDAVGKSTLMALLAGAIELQEGSIEVLGGDIAQFRHRKKISPKIAYMPQGLGKNLFMELSLRENLDFFGRLFNKPKQQRLERIDILLNVANLAAFADRPAGKLSGGMKQKLGLCCALLHDPEFLILDEPTTGVDPVSRRQFWQLISSMRELHPDINILVSTAYMDEAEKFEWVIAMHAGIVLDTGSPDEIKTRCQTDSLEDAFVVLMPKNVGALNSDLVLSKPNKNHTKIAIKARNLTRRFGEFTAVDNVSFDIKHGEIYGFLGSNGCGKTTTMKMLTGLLMPSEGSVSLFGKPLSHKDLQARYRVGYMSQSFSLYGVLTVLQNLRLHARLFSLSTEKQKKRINDLIDRFHLATFIDTPTSSLPLGIKQRISLAIAIIHEPELLILDEPTSGVDPIARNQFWQILTDLSHQEGVTIFISTHFMSEAMRCDKVSLMHAGKVLVDDSPEKIIQNSGTDNFEDAAIYYIESAMSESELTNKTALSALEQSKQTTTTNRFLRSWQRLWAHSIRETHEILRDPIRLAFSFLGMTMMLFILTYGIAPDVDEIRFASFDLDQSPESHDYLDNLNGSKYFSQLPSSSNPDALHKRLLSRDIHFSIEVPQGFGANIQKANKSEILVVIDGANPSQAATIESYILSAHQDYLRQLKPELMAQIDANLNIIVPRFRYNPSMENINAIAPAIPAFLLILFPALLSAISVVREKEIGTIVNFYVTPATRLEFLLGKQLPYIAVGLINFIILILSVIYIMDVPLKGSGLALFLGGFIYLIVAINYGLLTSAFSKTQAAAVFITAILSILPTVSFSGMSQPVSTLESGAQVIGKFWPTTYFINISVGSFTKGLPWQHLSINLFYLSLFIPLFLAMSMLFLKKQRS